MAQTTPGVYVTESPFKASVAPQNTRATVAAFLGTATRGGTAPVLVRSWPQYRAEFGDLDVSVDLGYAVYQYFANGGQDAYVTRVFGASSTTASATVIYQSIPLTGASSTGTLMVLDAKNPGGWANTSANGLTVAVSAGTISQGVSAAATFNLQVLLAGSEVEYWPDLSPDPNSSRYVVTMLNNYSSYVRVRSGNTTITPSAGTVSYQTAGSFTGGSTVAAGTADWTTALDKLNDLPGSLLINCVGQSEQAIVNAALTKAEDLGTSFVIVDPDPTATTTSAMSNKVAGYSPKGWGAAYYPMLVMSDPAKSGPGAIRNTFPGGAIAGAYVRTEVARTVAKAPAGYSTDIRNALNVAVPLSEQQVGTIYNSGVNYLKAVPGAGVVVLGARTLETVRPDKYVPIRRSLNYIKQRSSDLTQFAVFEPNDERLWNAIKVRLGNMLTEFWAAGGLKGETVGQAFYITCDASNNTENTIANGEVRVELGVALQYPAEFIIINISQFAGGSTL